MNTTARAHGCKSQGDSIVCTATAQGSPGRDVFAVTTYDATNATGAVLSVGTVQAKIAGGGGNVPISNTLSLTLDGVIATLAVSIVPGGGKRGDPVKAAVTLDAFDASGAQIVGPSDYSIPIVLTIQGDGERCVRTARGGTLGLDADHRQTAVEADAELRRRSTGVVGHAAGHGGRAEHRRARELQAARASNRRRRSARSTRSTSAPTTGWVRRSPSTTAKRRATPRRNARSTSARSSTRAASPWTRRATCTSATSIASSASRPRAARPTPATRLRSTLRTPAATRSLRRC